MAVLLVLLARTNNLDDRPSVVQTRERYAPGSCVIVSAGTNGDPQVSEAPCGAANSRKVASKIEFPKSCPSQTVNVVLVPNQMSLCLYR